MKKYFGVVLAGLALAISLSIGGASAQGVCVTAGGQPGTFQGSICIGTGGTGNPNQGNPNQGTPAYQQGQYQRSTGTTDLTFISTLLAQIGGIIRMLPPILTGAAVIVFFYYLIKYFMTQVPDEKNNSMKRMGYSLLAIFVMVALWGILAFFGDAIGINPNTTVNAVKLPR